ncbi:SprT family protein [Streptococcus sciuri]|uniref:Protein SprT-like n=1 Tax=Streptococcus sciuri TaxID=2973939 RepID=A0ABT2F7C8_9STRE|nr:SprT family protein [Streptococcus sciuri]MCS4488324.1 SprT family protein [Streptococcus sciuri]
MNLTDYVKTVSLEDFNKPFLHKAYWNKRLRTTGGRFFPDDGHLDFNPKMYEKFGCEIFRKIVRHELCHYHLYYDHKGFRHRDKDFKVLLQQVDGLRYAPNLNQASNLYEYTCQSCHKVYKRKRRINTQKYVCSFCRGQLMMKNQS